MKRAAKESTSEIVTNGISYNVSGNNSYLSNILRSEQRNFCAYTEKQISATDLVEIDHFDPNLKGQLSDNYENWYLIVAKWNRKKSKKWINFQPILYPTSTDFNSRVWFEDGIFQYNTDDIEAKNLINLLDLNNYELTKERERYIERLHDLINSLGEDGLRSHLVKFPEQIHFLSALEANFNYRF